MVFHLTKFCFNFIHFMVLHKLNGILQLKALILFHYHDNNNSSEHARQNMHFKIFMEI